MVLSQCPGGRDINRSRILRLRFRGGWNSWRPARCAGNGAAPPRADPARPEGRLRPYVGPNQRIEARAAPPLHADTRSYQYNFLRRPETGHRTGTRGLRRPLPRNLSPFGATRSGSPAVREPAMNARKIGRAGP